MSDIGALCEAKGNGHSQAISTVTDDAAFGYPRDFLENKFVYLVISPRAGGLSIGVNLNPVVTCNFNCLYCEVPRTQPPRAEQLDIEQMAGELSATIALANAGNLHQRARYASLPRELLQLRHVAVSGDGEPTLAAGFAEALQAIVHIRALGRFPFFKIVLLTNSTNLDDREVQRALNLLTKEDEIWAKLDAGTQGYFTLVNGSTVSIEKVSANILAVAKNRPVVIQSLFPAIDGIELSSGEIEQYAGRLKELREAGARISLVQIYSATRPMAKLGCSHLPLRKLSEIARTVRRIAGLRAEVF